MSKLRKNRILMATVTATAASAIAAGTAMSLGGPGSALAASAAAGDRNGKCESGEFCYYYNSGNKGSLSDFRGSVANYGDKQPSCYEYKGKGKGKGRCVKNDAASAWNRSSKTVRVYFNSNYGGNYQDFKPGQKANLKAGIKNQNASHEFGPSKRTRMSYGLYKLNGGKITAGFDGYHNTPGRHEGIDIARKFQSKVRALTSGTVINVVRGHTGGSGLSTIAVYMPAQKKTVIYLHSAPADSLRVGQKIKRGQVIALESWRGISSKSAAHTHVEMRPGRKKLAAKSVGDPHLDNPNPTKFWNSQGYTVR